MIIYFFSSFMSHGKHGYFELVAATHKGRFYAKIRTNKQLKI